MRDIVVFGIIFGLVPMMIRLESAKPGQATAFDTVGRDLVDAPGLATGSGVVHARS